MFDGRRLAATLVLALGATGALGTHAPAEVGLIIHPNGGTSSYVLQTVIDETEPVGSAWIRFFSDGSYRRVLNEQGSLNGDGPPSPIVRASDGLPVVAWSRNSPSGYDIVVGRFDGAQWTAPEIVAAATADERDPYLVLDPADGAIHLLYWVDDAEPRVLHRQAPADLSSWSAPLDVSQPGEVACRPSAAFHDGVLHVAYETHAFGPGSVPREIVVAARDDQSFVPELVATTQHDGANWPRLHAGAGRLWIDWIDSESDLAWRRRDASGTWEPIETQPFQSYEDREFHARGRIRTLALD